MYYCRKCKRIFKVTLSEICECGKKLNATSEDYVEAYLNKGYILNSDEKQKNEEIEQDRDIESVKKDILHSMGVESYTDLFQPERIINQFIQEESDREIKRKEKVWLEKEKRKKMQQEHRKQVVNKLDNAGNFENKDHIETVFDVENFLNSLGLQKKKNET